MRSSHPPRAPQLCGVRWAPPTIHLMNDAWVLFDARTGLHVGWYFWLRVLDEVNRSARYGHPFGLVLLDVDAGAKRARVDEAMVQVTACIRGTDLAGRIGETRAGVLLPHQDVAHAEEAAARIVRQLERTAGREVSWSSRLLTYPVEAPEISNLLTLGSTERHGAAPDGNVPVAASDDPRR